MNETPCKEQPQCVEKAQCNEMAASTSMSLLPVAISLTDTKLSALEALSLRPGMKLDFERAVPHMACVRVGEVAVCRGIVKVEQGGLVLEISEVVRAENIAASTGHTGTIE